MSFHDPNHPRTALVVGAGIGGLTAAIALRRAGLDVRVLERTPELREVGAGISVWPNAVKALRRLGVGPVVEAAGRPSSEGGFRTAGGAPLGAASTGDLADHFGAPLLTFHRAALHGALRSALGDGAIRLGAEVAGLDQDGGGVTVELADGTRERADVVIGADGLRSAVRATVLGRDHAPRYSGITCWRGVVRPDAVLDARLQPGESWGRGSVFGLHRLPDGTVYWYATAHAREGRRAPGGDEQRAAHDVVRGWHDPLPALVEATPNQAIIRGDLYDRPPLETFAYGRVALLGDAAHPMVPKLGQGACQAIEDAEALGAALAGTHDPELALALYSDARTHRARSVVVQSRRLLRLSHVRSSLGVALRNRTMRRMSPEQSLRRLAPIIGYEPRGAAA